MIHKVTAVYQYGGPVEFDVEITETHIAWRQSGEKKWTRAPWNSAIADMEAGIDQNITFEAMRRLMRKPKKHGK